MTRSTLLCTCLVLPLLLACGKKEAPPHAATATKTVQPTVAAPEGEPSEADLRRLVSESYERIERAGGAPVTMTANGQSLTLRPKLHEVVRKQSCKRTPGQPPDWYVCTVIVKLSFKGLTSKPSEGPSHVGVKWDATKGAWVLQ